MICPKCGEELHEDAKFCDACGCSIEQQGNNILNSTKVFTGMGEQDETFQVQSTSLEMEKKRAKKNKKKGGLVSFLIVVAMVAVLGLAGVFVYQMVYEKPYERAIGEMFSPLNERSITLDTYLESLFPSIICKDIDDIIKAYCEETGMSYAKVVAELNKQIGKTMDEFEDRWGSDFKFDYDVIDERKLSSEELEEVSDAYKNVSQLFSQYSTSGDTLKDEGKMKSYEAYNKLLEDFSNMEFEEGYELEVELSMENVKGKDDTEQKTSLYVVKTDGKWMVDLMHYLNQLGDLGLFNQLN